MEILNNFIAPGQSKVINLNIAKLHTGTSLAVPIIIERAKVDGPCLLLTAGIHGDEVNGVEIVRQIISQGYNKPTTGMVICVPVVNVFGFLSKIREFPDGRDLNRMFPGAKNGSLASRFAYYIVKAITPHVDYCIDYHTGGGERFNYSQIRIDGSNEETLNLAKVFGVKFIMDAKNRDKSFRETLTSMGKHVLLFEGGKSLHLDRIVTQLGVNGALRIMSHLGIRDFSQELLESPFAKASDMVVVKDSTWIRAKHSGMFRSYKSIGAFVKKGDVLGTLSDPYGGFEVDVKATYEGYVICATQAPIVNEGDALFHITKRTVKVNS